MSRVLLIEDNPGGLLALSGALELKLAGVQVETATSAEAGLALLDQHQFDVVICDVLLPGMDGIQFLRSVLGRQPELSVILITAGEFMREADAMSQGAVAFLPKPLDVGVLVKTVQIAFERTRVLREARECRLKDLR